VLCEFVHKKTIHVIFREHRSSGNGHNMFVLALRNMTGTKEETQLLKLPALPIEEMFLKPYFQAALILKFNSSGSRLVLA